MWQPKTLTSSDLDRSSVNAVLNGIVPAIIIKGFYSKLECSKLLHEIKNQGISEFKVDKLNHIGPFLMAHTTNKKQYFEEAKNAKQIFKDIFYKIENPMKKVHNKFQIIFPKYDIKTANEEDNEYSECIIRIHEKGKKIPIHKDNVTYEGKEYSISDIDKQLSCVLHIQKSEKGGELTIYNKEWTKQDEKNREIAFGYSEKVVLNQNQCQISNVEQGDMVIINPNYYHTVSEIAGITSRITLGIFFPFSSILIMHSEYSLFSSFAVLMSYLGKII